MSRAFSTTLDSAILPCTLEINSAFEVLTSTTNKYNQPSRKDMLARKMIVVKNTSNDSDPDPNMMPQMRVINSAISEQDSRTCSIWFSKGR